jgi:hypothetical protein
MNEEDFQSFRPFASRKPPSTPAHAKEFRQTTESLCRINGLRFESNRSRAL